MHRFPDETITTPEIALAALAAHADVVDDASLCSGLWQSLSNAARAGAEAPNPDWPTVKALWLVADACSLMLDGDSTNAPFGPLAVFEHGRSAVPEDFTAEHLALFSAVAEGVTNRALRARLSDLSWLCAEPRKFTDALRAIDAYVAEVPTEENRATSLDEWRRALTLCIQLRKGAGDRLDKIEGALESLAEASIPLEGGLGLAAARVLFDRHLSEGRGGKLAELIAARGEATLATGPDFWNARAYLDLAGRWFERLGLLERAADMTLQVALSFEAETDQRISQDAGAGHLVGTTFLENAIQTLRKIPKDQRPSRKVEEHLQRLARRLTESGEKAVQTLVRVPMFKTDIREIVELSEQVVSGKPLLDALLTLTHRHSGASLSQLTQKAEKALNRYVLGRLFGSSHMRLDGRVIAKTPGGGLEGDTEDHKLKVWGKVMHYYVLDIELVCKGVILPAMGTILCEHNVSKNDLVQLMSLAPIVPPDRVEQFAKGLWEGFQFDFATATYLLAPQLEHLVRWHLKEVGVKTSNLDKEGIENEVGLSTLIEMPEIQQILDTETAFEMKALFCSALGPNLRNEVAHGLLNAAQCHSVGSIYAWWWVLRLTLRSFWASRRAAAEKPPQADSAEDAAATRCRR